MKYTIEGFQQKRLIELGLKCRDACILRFIVDFYNTGKMKKKMINEKEFFWIDYDYALKELPIISIKKKQFGRIFKKFVENGLMEMTTIKRIMGGTNVYFRFVQPELLKLLSSDGHNGKDV